LVNSTSELNQQDSTQLQQQHALAA
jgi:hypothetical protein